MSRINWDDDNDDDNNDISREFRVLSGHLLGETTLKLRNFPSKKFRQVYSGIKNPLIAVIKLNAVIYVQLPGNTEICYLSNEKLSASGDPKLTPNVCVWIRACQGYTRTGPVDEKLTLTSHAIVSVYNQSINPYFLHA